MSSSQTLFAALLAGAAAVTTGVSGCSGNGAGLNSNGQPLASGGGGGTVPLTADFQSIQQNVFTPICSPCHSGASAPEGLMLDAAHSYNLLVGVPSTEVPTFDRVKAGDPNNSYIILKLQGSNGIVGSRMPLNEPPLPQSTIAIISQWITNGAPQGTTTASAKAMEKLQALGQNAAPPFSVSYTSPVDEAVVDTPVAHIVLVFNHEVNASLVNYTTLQLERIEAPTAASSTGAQTASTAQAMAIPTSAALADGNTSTVVITPHAPLLSGTYRVTARGSGGGALADLNAQVLGSDYSFTFTVDGSP
jgi:methionine-rich copper-binding protein CopC